MRRVLGCLFHEILILFFLKSGDFFGSLEILLMDIVVPVDSPVLVWLHTVLMLKLRLVVVELKLSSL